MLPPSSKINGATGNIYSSSKFRRGNTGRVLARVPKVKFTASQLCQEITGVLNLTNLK